MDRCNVHHERLPGALDVLQDRLLLVVFHGHQLRLVVVQWAHRYQPWPISLCVGELDLVGDTVDGSWFLPTRRNHRPIVVVECLLHLIVNCRSVIKL